jgi:hypothetical protein
MASSRRTLATMTIPVFLTKQLTVAAMEALMGQLATELDAAQNAILYQPQGAAAAYIIDTFRADIPSFYTGLGGPSPFVLRQSVGPLILKIDREPDFRGAGTHL